jgi:UDP-N-acetylglucosamine acyltransferase
MDHAVIGSGSRIFPGAVIAAIPQDLKFQGEPSQVIIGENVTIREYVTINRGTIDRYQTSVGDNTLIMAYTHVAHDTYIGSNCVIANSVNLAGHIQLGDWVVIGGMSAIQQFVKIGPHAFIGGGSLVRKDVPPYVKAAREPLSYVGVNSVGLRRRGFSQADIHHIQDIYRILFVKGLNVTNALDTIEAEVPATRLRDEILRFIRSSDKGVMRGFNHLNDSQA